MKKLTVVILATIILMLQMPCNSIAAFANENTEDHLLETDGILILSPFSFYEYPEVTGSRQPYFSGTATEIDSNGFLLITSGSNLKLTNLRTDSDMHLQIFALLNNGKGKYSTAGFHMGTLVSGREKYEGTFYVKDDGNISYNPGHVKRISNGESIVISAQQLNELASQLGTTDAYFWLRPRYVNSNNKYVVSADYIFRIDDSWHSEILSEVDEEINALVDVPEDAYYAEPVKWAIRRDITSGTSANTFSPHQTCTRAQILTFLWKAYNCPKPTIENPYTDITENDYYYEPALWAYENQMISGNVFNAKTPCTRGDSMTYIWKAAGKPIVTAENKFVDVTSDTECDNAVSWALENNITAGISEATFGTNYICTRAQIITFLYKVFQ